MNSHIYSSLNFITIPLNGKQPFLKNWQSFGHSAPVEQGQNLGVILGGPQGLVDVDLDCPTALAVADVFLPDTPLQFGRASTPGAHRLYSVKDCGGRVAFQSRQNAFSKKMLVEYRAEGCQTMAPPSQHPNGEAVVFHRDGKPATVARACLLSACSLIAVVCELAPHYCKGKRQDFAMAIAGTLLSAGLSPDNTANVLRALAMATGDEDFEQRLAVVGRTAQLLKSDSPCTQRQGLIDLIGADGPVVLSCIEEHLRKGGLVNEARATVTRTSEDRLEITDSTIGRLFAHEHANQVAYVKEMKAFYVYEEGVWSLDKEGLAVGRLFDAMIRSRSENLRGREFEAFLRYRGARNASHALAMAKQHLQGSMRDFDQHDELLPVRNGVIDLRKGHLLPHAPQYKFTMKLDVDFDPEALCPRFGAFIEETFDLPDPDHARDLAQYVQTILGYALTGRMDRQELFIFYGLGRNGKSILTEIVMRLMGAYARSLMSETLFASKWSSTTAANDLSTLENSRLAVASEADMQGKLNGPLIKRVTGCDIVKVRRLYADPYDCKLKCKLIMVCNQMPDFDTNDAALKRRLRVIPFGNVLPEAKVNRTLSQSLWMERSGVLNWLIQGARRYFSGDLQVPQAVIKATEEYFSDKDTVSSFISERLVRARGERISKAEMFEAYEEYCFDEGLEPLTKKPFGKSLQAKGFEDTRSGDTRSWKHVSFAPPQLGNGVGLSDVSDA